MKRKLYTLLLLTILSACHNATENIPSTDIGTPVPLNIHIGGIYMQERSFVTVESDLKDKNIGIYAINANANETSYGTAPAGTSATYTVTNGSTIKPSPNQELWLNNQTATIYAAYPISNPNDIQAGSNAADAPLLPVSNSTFALTHTFSEAPVTGTPDYYDLTQPGYDYMYGVNYTADFTDSNPPTANNTSPAVTIGFKHALAQLYIKVVKGNDYPGPAILTSIVCTFSGPPSLKAGNASLMSLKDGSISNTETTASLSYSYTISAPNVTLDTDGLEVRNYALPAMNAVLSEARITIDGKTMTISPAKSATWEAGKRYRYTFTAKGTGLSMTGFQTVDWTKGAELNDVTIQ